MNEIEDTAYQNLWDAIKSVVTWKFIKMPLLKKDNDLKSTM